MKPMGGRTWKYWPASGPVFFGLPLFVYPTILRQADSEWSDRKAMRFKLIVAKTRAPTKTNYGLSALSLALLVNCSVA